MAVPAPHNITEQSLADAQRRFDEFRLEIWQSTSAQRGHPFRAKVMTLAPVGSRRFSLLALTGALFLRTARKVGFDRQPITRVSPEAFPFGFALSQELGSDSSNEAVLAVEEPNNPSSWENLNAALVGRSVVIVKLAGTELGPGGAEALLSQLKASGGAIVTGDDVVRTKDGRLMGRFRPNQLGLASLLSYDAVGGVAGFDVAALLDLGGFSTNLGSLGLIDAAFRLVEAGQVSSHASNVVATSTPRTGDEMASHTEWVSMQLKRLGFRASTTTTTAGIVRWRATPMLWPSVTIVIPTRDRLDLLQRCLAGVERSSYPNFHVVICDNDSVEPATLQYFAETSHTVVAAPGPFNYSTIVNRGVAHTTSDFVLTLNNDVEIHDLDWIERLVSVAKLPRVGLVGCALQEPDGAYNHESIALAPYPQHLRRDLNYTRVDDFLSATREVSAVTGACTLVDRVLWEQLGGLDPTLEVIGNDVDLCLRASQAGFLTVYVADLQLTHAESSSRGSLNPPEDIYKLVARWGLFNEFVDPWFPGALRIIADQVVWQP